MEYKLNKLYVECVNELKGKLKFQFQKETIKDNEGIYLGMRVTFY